MIAIDTNVVLRYLLNDHPIQSRKAADLVLGAQAVLVTDIVLAESIWTLRGKKYRLSRDEIVSALDSLFAEPNIVFEDSQSVWRALHVYRKEKADFPDLLIYFKSRSTADAQGVPFSGFYTFDKAAAGLPGTHQL